METIDWDHFEKVQICIGTVVKVENFPEAKKPAFKLWINLGEFGVKKSSAQITKHYTMDELVHRQVVCVINFPPRQIGPFMSEVLVTGFADENGDILLTRVDKKVPNGTRLS